MSAKSKIEWTNMTWNISTGCTKISEGCLRCYAERMSYRLQAMGLDKYRNGFNLTLHENELFKPYGWKTPSMVFVDSMSDLFHESMMFGFIKDAFRVMNECPQHTFQILTKRADILEEYSHKLSFSPNIWVGVTVESNKYLKRIDHLRNVSASVKFLSIEPMLSPMHNLDLSGIDWVIVGGESGPHARPIEKDWVIDIKEQCEEKDIPFFFKQWGGTNKKVSGSLLDGKEYKNLPKFKNHLILSNN